MKTAILLLIFSVLLSAAAFVDPAIAQVDDFEDGTLQGWSGGADHSNIPTGGPAGADDNYLQVKRPTVALPSPFHIGTKNTTTWSGDYLTAGVKGIAMDVNATAVTSASGNLALRIVLFGPGGAFSSRDPITVITDSGWQHIEFGLTRSDLVRVFGSGGSWVDPGPGVDDLTYTLSNIDTLLIRHDSGPDPRPIGTHPEHIYATLGIDNISTLLGPAPTYDVAWTFDNQASQSYILDSFEPNDVALGDVNTNDPTLLLYLGKRYQVTILNPLFHPFEVIAKGASSGLDVVQLSMSVVGPFESDPNVAWVDNGIGTATFTLTDDLYDAMIVPDKRPGYRCGIHVISMRGDFDICTAPIASDLDGNCSVDFFDFTLFALDWFDGNADFFDLTSFPSDWLDSNVVP